MNTLLYISLYEKQRHVTDISVKNTYKNTYHEYL